MDSDAYAAKWIMIKNCVIVISVCSMVVTLYSMSGSMVSLWGMIGFWFISTVEINEDEQKKPLDN